MARKPKAKRKPAARKAQSVTAPAPVPTPAIPLKHDRFDYSPIIDRPKLEWPNGARVALWVISVLTLLGCGKYAVMLWRYDRMVRFWSTGMLLAAAPIGEPVARHGPFVMNTREEIQQALEDYYLGRF